jgi:hypothetical protein
MKISKKTTNTNLFISHRQVISGNEIEKSVLVKVNQPRVLAVVTYLVKVRHHGVEKRFAYSRSRRTEIQAAATGKKKPNVSIISSVISLLVQDKRL